MTYEHRAVFNILSANRQLEYLKNGPCGLVAESSQVPSHFNRARSQSGQRGTGTAGAWSHRLGHLVNQPHRAIVLAHQEENVTHVGADGAREVFRPLELVHQPEALPVKVDGNETALRVENGTAG